MSDHQVAQRESMTLNPCLGGLCFLTNQRRQDKQKRKKKMDYKKNAKYFKKVPTPPIKVIGGLIVACVVAVSLNLVQPFAVITVGVIVLLYLIATALGRPSDSDIDAQLESLMKGLKEQALRKLGVDEEEIKIAPPLFLKGYSFGASRLGDVANQKLFDVRGKDGLWRSPECVLSAWFFTESQIHYYRRTVSLVSPSYKEYTDEFFYKDVVSIKTDEHEAPWVDPKTGRESRDYKKRWTAFMLRNAGGETTECVCNSTEEADNAVNAMRSLVRQKKNA